MFTPDELQLLAQQPRDELAVKLAGSSPPEELAMFLRRTERLYLSQVTGYESLMGDTMAWIVEVHGPGGVAQVLPAVRTYLLGHPDAAAGAAPHDPEAAAAGLDRVVAAAAAGDVAGALAHYDEVADHWRAMHDLLRDWHSALLSEVYRLWGPDALAELYVRTSSLLADFRAGDLARSPRERLPVWLRLLKGHFSSLSVEETDDTLVIVQDPCGTCGRQLEDGRYDGPGALAVVTEPHEITWGRGDTPIYRTHVPVWHVRVPRAEIGVPWPVNQCPAGLAAGPCRIVLYKDPLDPAADAAVPSA